MKRFILGLTFSLSLPILAPLENIAALTDPKGNLITLAVQNFLKNIVLGRDRVYYHSN